MLKMFSMFDVKAAAFSAPMFIPTRGLALRSLSDAVAAKDSPLAQYPEDYQMYELGEFDPATGKIVALPQPEVVCSVASIVQQLKGAREEVKL